MFQDRLQSSLAYVVISCMNDIMTGKSIILAQVCLRDLTSVTVAAGNIFISVATPASNIKRIEEHPS